MTATTPLEQALVAWNRYKRDTDALQASVDDAVALAETGVFSNRNIAHITGLKIEFVNQLTKKTDKSGGRLNPEALPLIYDIWLQWAQARTFSIQAVRTVVNLGVSPGMISKLTGISRSPLYKRLQES